MSQGNFVHLTSGGGYDFADQQLFGPYDRDADLIYPLAGINRFGRHTVVDWKVAIHSVAVGLCIGDYLRDQGASMEESLDGEAAGLMHDAHESVIGDITTPVAWEIGYTRIKQLKAASQQAIEDKLNIPNARRASTWERHVKDADAAALHVEKALFCLPPSRDWNLAQPGPEWMQPMFRVVTWLLSQGAHEDGGLEWFKHVYDTTVGR